MFWIFAEPIARLFSDDPAVIEVLVLYVRIIPIGYGLMEIHRYNGFFLSGLRKPLQATALNLIRVLVLLLPLSLLGNNHFGLHGLYFGAG